MSSDRNDDEGRQDPQGRQETTPFWPPAAGSGRPQQPDQPAWGQEQHDQQSGRSPSWGEQPSWGQQPAWGQQPGQGQYGNPEYGQTPYGQAPYGQAPYGQAPYTPAASGQWSPGGYGFGQDAAPARPGGVVTSAVLGFVFGALGLLVSVLLLAGGALIDNLFDTIEESDPALSGGLGPEELDSVRGFFLVLAVLALAWTVLMIWGSALAVRGRTRVPLLVGSSITVAFTGLMFVLAIIGAASGTGQEGEAGGVVLLVLMFGAALAMLVLLCLRPAAQYFTVHRQRRP